MSVPVRVVIVFHSGYGHTIKIAEASTEVKVRKKGSKSVYKLTPCRTP